MRIRRARSEAILKIGRDGHGNGRNDWLNINSRDTIDKRFLEYKLQGK